MGRSSRDVWVRLLGEVLLTTKGRTIVSYAFRTSLKCAHASNKVQRF